MADADAPAERVEPADVVTPASASNFFAQERKFWIEIGNSGCSRSMNSFELDFRTVAVRRK